MERPIDQSPAVISASSLENGTTVSPTYSNSPTMSCGSLPPWAIIFWITSAQFTLDMN